MWENLVGRSRGFWRHFWPRAQSEFPAAFGSATLDPFYAAINTVRPGLIRVEADEATYNMHIIIRFELEQALLEDSLRVGDLPQAWNDAYERNLGLRPPRDADGVLQDVHWSAGLFGYFPTYSLGNIFASQLFSKANADLGDLQDLFAQGQFAPLLQWLRAQVHRVGNRYSSRELVAKITGQPLDSQPLLNHLRSKLLPIYGL
jgi:carboxypeptidase Taq